MTASVTELRALAELRHARPGVVRDQVRSLLENDDLPAPVHSTALWVLGLALHELGQPTDAIICFRDAIRRAIRDRDPHMIAVSRASLAHSLLSAGDSAAAYIQMAQAKKATPDDAVGFVELLSGVMLQRTGRLDEALACFDRNLPGLRRAGDRANVARLLLNRGILFAYQGRFSRAVTDLGEAEKVAAELELWVLAAMAAHNLGFAQGRRGDVPAGLAGFDRARAAYRELGDPPRLVAVLAADSGELLLRAGLARDARIGAQRALGLLGESSVGDAAHNAEIRLLLAQAYLAESRFGEAELEATHAAAAFRSARRLPWAALADYEAIKARVMATEDGLPPGPDMIASARRIADSLDVHGWPIEAMHVRTFIGRIAVATGQFRLAHRELAPVAGGRRGGTIESRATAWHAAALLRLAEGDRPRAKRALRRGLVMIDEYRATLGTSELRAGASVRATELGRLGLRLALADGRAREVLRWAERWRAGSLRLPPVTPPEDASVAAALGELREAQAELRRRTLDGLAPDHALGHTAGRIRRLQEDLRARTLRAAPTTIGKAAAIDLRGLRRALGSSVLVEYIALEGQLHAVAVSDQGASLHHLGGVERISSEKSYLLSRLRSLLSTPARSRSRPQDRPAVEPLSATGSRLAQLLLDPLRLDPAAPLVIVPTGPLHGIPWGALPGLRGRPVTVAPSAQLWLHRAKGAPTARGDRVALVLGPDLTGAAVEISQLAEAYPACRVLAGPDATVAGVLAAFERTDLIHIAAHGEFRADSPLFSSLRLVDGALTVYDMEPIRSPPATVVLPSCEAAKTEVMTGDELVGATVALLGIGVRSVIAASLPIPDDATIPLMLALHRGLRTGATPSHALAAAAVEIGERPVDQAVAAAFSCLGAGESATAEISE